MSADGLSWNSRMGTYDGLFRNGLNTAEDRPRGDSRAQVAPCVRTANRQRATNPDAARPPAPIQARSGTTRRATHAAVQGPDRRLRR